MNEYVAQRNSSEQQTLRNELEVQLCAYDTCTDVQHEILLRCTAKVKLQLPHYRPEQALGAPGG